MKAEIKIGSKVTNLRKNLTQYNRLDKDKEVEKYLDDILNGMKSVSEDLGRLIRVVSTEADNDMKKIQ